ncbi:MAG: response regulator [Chloroflexi bacterium]|nr:response regulator [Chloroflexota bacterium]
MSSFDDGSAIARHWLFVLDDGHYVVQWDDTRVQDLLSGEYLAFDHDRDFGHAITDDDLHKLKKAGRVERYNRNYVWLHALPEGGRFELRTMERSPSRVRSYYLNTTLPGARLRDVKAVLKHGGLDGRLFACEHEELVAVFGKDGSSFAQLGDAEAAQRRLLTLAPQLFGNMAVAFIETSSADPQNGHAPPTRHESDEFLDLDSLIASQTDTSVTAGKCAVVACGNAQEMAQIAQVLHAIKMDIQPAATAKQAMYLLEDRPPNLLIMDMQMPDMHGWEMLGKVRELHDLDQLRIIVLGEDDPNEGDQTFAVTVAGVSLYLVKPVSSGRLRQGVWSVFKDRPMP